MDDSLHMVLTEARRVFGPEGQVEYGVDLGHWASAGLLSAEQSKANEITVWGERPLERLLACLRALPDHVAAPVVTAGSRTRSRSSQSSGGAETEA